MYNNSPRNAIQLQPLETNLDNAFSRSQESIYSVQTYLESIDEKSILNSLRKLSISSYN